MKHKLSISIDAETALRINEKLKGSEFRNKSHVVEFAVKKFLEEKNSGEEKND